MTTTYEFQTRTDIANRALEMCGAKRITAFTDNSVAASEIQFVYDKLRQAELRRNVWRCATRRTALRPLDTTSLLLTPPAWSATITYQVGSIVSYDSMYWVSNLVAGNYGNTPGVSTTWEPYFGPQTADLYDTTGATGYYAGELLYYSSPSVLLTNYQRLYVARPGASTTGSTTISTDPSSTPDWASTTTYQPGDTVNYSASTYICLVPNNLNIMPSSTYSAWASGTTYASGDKIVDITTGRIFASQVSSNTGNNPLTDSGANWAVVGSSPYYQAWLAWTNANQNQGWATQPDGFTLTPPRLIYPINSGPASQTGTQNLFMLPNGFLRRAPMNPQNGSISFLGGPLGNTPDDYQFENDYFVSRETYPIVFRFVADITDVTKMDPMFCEGLAARIAMAVAPRLTQSEAKFSTLSGYYRAAMVEARLENAIETGPVEPPEDEWISVRI